jgi:hypothetical protein
LATVMLSVIMLIVVAPVHAEQWYYLVKNNLINDCKNIENTAATRAPEGHMTKKTEAF